MHRAPATNHTLKIALFLSAFLSYAFGAVAGTVTTDNEANTSDHVSLYYNKADKDYGTGKIIISVTGLTASQTYKLWITTAGLNSGWEVVGSFTADGSGASQGLWTPSASTSTLELSHTQLLSELGTDPDDGKTFRFGTHSSNINQDPASNGDGVQFTLVDDGSKFDFTYDVTPPTASSLTERYLKSTATTLLSGDGFKTNGDTPAAPNGIKINGSFPITSYAVDSDDQITITAPTGDFEGLVLVRDAAGNFSTTGPTITVDNTKPSVTTIGTVSIKNGATSVISGTGFSTSGGASPIETVSLGGTTSPHTFSVDEDNNQITVTASTGNYGGDVVVTDAAGNSSDIVGTKEIFVDNSAPTITDISSTLRRPGQTFTLDGTGFQENSIDVTMTIGGSVPTGLTYVVYSNILITVTCGSGEVYDGTILLTDDAGNTSNTSYSVTIDNTKPVVNSVSEQYIRGGVTTIISGDGFKDNQNNATTVKLTGTVTRTYSVGTGPGTFVVNTDETITLTGHNTEDVTDGIVTVTDAAGNESDAGTVSVTVDNVDPTVTGFGTSPALIKSGAQILIKGTGFNTGSPVASVTIGGVTSAAGGFSYTIVDDGNIRLTAGGTTVPAGNVVVTDESGNSSTEVGKTLEIDNVAPVFSDITPVSSGKTALKNGAQAVITGSGFRNSSFTENTDAEVYIGSTVSGNWGTGSSKSVNGAGTEITITAGSVDQSGVLKIVDKAGNETSVTSNTIYFDNTAPTVTSVWLKVIKNGSQTTVTGAGFQFGGDAQKVTVNGIEPTGASFTVNGGGEIIFTAGTEEVNGQIVVTDAAGNVSTNDVKLTIDNTPPVVTSVSPASIKSGNSATVTGSGFQSIVDGVANNEGATATVGGSTPTGMTVTVVDDETVTLTAGSGEVTEGDVVILDRAGNASTATGKTLTIDNTAPTITSVSPSAIKSGASATVSGTGFKVGGIPTSVTVGGSVPTGMDTSSITNTSLVITAGSGNKTDGQIVITDAAGNLSTSAIFLTINNIPPDVTMVSPSVVKSGDNFTITGSGFTVGGDASAVEVGASVPTGLSFTVDSKTQITGTAGSGEVTSGNVTVSDAAGNESTDTGKLLTIDNTAPTLASISDRWITNGDSTTLTGSGFATNGNATQVTVGGSTPTGLTFNVDSDTKITITGGTGEVTRGTVVVFDTVGNPSTQTSIKLSVDNTAPVAPTLSLHSSWDSGFFNDDNISFYTDPGMIVSGTVAGDSVTVLMNGTAVVLGRRASGTSTSLFWGSSNQSIGGNTSITGGDGTYSFTATSTDSAENVSGASSALSYRLDTTAPSTPIISGLASASNTGESSTDKITKDNTPSFQITNVTTGNVLIVNYRETDDSSFSSVTTDKDTIDAVPYTVTVTGGLNDGADHDIYITHFDTAGNNVSSSVFSNFTIDTQRPTGALSYSDSLVRFEDDQVTITATFSDGMNSTVLPTISIDLPETTSDISAADMTATANDSVWTYTLSLLDNIDGTATVTVDGTDNAGNALLTGSTTGTQVLRIDNTDPSYTSVSPDTGAFINHKRLAWVLSEDLFSGTAAFNRVSGPGTSVTASLTGSELAAATRTAAELTNSPSLVDGTKYNLVLTGVDSAGNTGSVTLSDITYDTTGVTVDSLVYSKNPVKPGDTLFISAFFSEIVPSAPSVSIEWPALTTQAVTLDSTVGGSLTQWAGSVQVPTTSGIAKVTPSARDRANNVIVAILGKTTLYDSTLVIDNAAPTSTFVYENLSQTQLQNKGKGQDVVRVTANLSEPANTSPAPTLSVQYKDSTDDSFEGLSAQSSADDDSTWVFQFTLPDSSKNDGKMALTISAADLAGNLVGTLVDSQKFEVDNTPPAAFATKGTTPIGSNVVPGWINGLTDSVEVIVPIAAPTVDPTLFQGGKVDIEMFNLNRGTDWVTVGPADSITTSGNNQPFYRSITEIETALPTNTALLQGDTLAVRAVITDRVGNKTNGTASEDTLVYDPNRPVSSAFVGGVVVTQDTLVSSDTLSAVWTLFTEPTPSTASGINRYEWAVEEVGSGVINGKRTWTSVGTDTSASAALALEHLKSYRVYVRAFDNAGNLSDTLSMTPDSLLRLNSAPVFAAIDSQFVDEDVAFSYNVGASDLDLVTLLGDTLHYTILDTGITGAANPMSLNEQSGQLAWNTPLQADTGNWNVTLRVADEWGFADTTIFVLTVNSVNDAPVVSQMPDVQFEEGVINGDTLSLNQYVEDVDDDTSTIVWTAVVAADTTTYPSYPLFFFGPGTTPGLERAIRSFMLGSHKPVGRISGGPEIRSLTGSSGLTVAIDTSEGSSFARFVADSNYYVDSRKVTFIATDPAGASDSTSILVTITPLNDPPRLLAIPDTSMFENDTLVLILRAIDIDDPLVTFQAIPDSSQISVTITDSVATFIPQALWSRQSNILVVVSDEELSDSTSFLLKVNHVTRPHLSLALGQNATFDRYYEIMITDTAEKALDLSLTVNPQGVAVSLDSAGQFTWVGSHKFDTTGVTVEFVMHGDARVGDTTITRSSKLTLARAKQAWAASSSDGIFHVKGDPGTVPFDRPFMIVDSLLFMKNQRDGGRYLMGHPLAGFSRPVTVSMDPDSAFPEKEQAIYQKSAEGIWRELPTVPLNGKLLTWTAQMGYFKLGKKTLVIPEATALGLNYPNPFNARTHIPVDIGFNGGPTQRVSIVVFNLLGQEVTVLNNGPMGIGRHDLVWDGRDGMGIPVSSGVYVVRLVAEAGISQAKKLILLR